MLTFSGRASYLRHEQTPRLFSYYSMIVLSHLMNFPRARVYQVRVERQSWLSARTLLVTTSNILKVSFQSFVQFFFLFFTVYIYPKRHTFAIIIKDTFAGAVQSDFCLPSSKTKCRPIYYATSICFLNKKIQTVLFPFFNCVTLLRKCISYTRPSWSLSFYK